MAGGSTPLSPRRCCAPDLSASHRPGRAPSGLRHARGCARPSAPRGRPTRGSRACCCCTWDAPNTRLSSPSSAISRPRNEVVDIGAASECSDHSRSTDRCEITERSSEHPRATSGSSIEQEVLEFGLGESVQYRDHHRPIAIETGAGEPVQADELLGDTRPQQECGCRSRSCATLVRRDWCDFGCSASSCSRTGTGPLGVRAPAAEESATR